MTSIDVITASFVMSHLQDYRAGLIEVYRVLKTAGVFAMTSWAASTNPYSEAWGQLLSEAVSKKRLQDGVNQVTPFAGYFEEEKNVNTAFTLLTTIDIMIGLDGSLMKLSFYLDWAYTRRAYRHSSFLCCQQRITNNE